MAQSIDAGGVHLSAHLAFPTGAARQAELSGPLPALVLCHGFPGGPGGAAAAGAAYPDLADRLAGASGWMVLTFNFRATGSSGGDFSPAGWMDDLRAALAWLKARPDVAGVWAAGSSAGGALAICAAAEDSDVRGVAALAAPADFDSWSEDPDGFVALCREVGLVKARSAAPDAKVWAGQLEQTRPVAVIAKVVPRPILLIQGADDDVVPTRDARILADAAGGGAELHILTGAGHRLRHDPRTIAVLLGWLERQTPAPAGG